MKKITEIELAGNAYITTRGSGSREIITDLGLQEWTSPDSICSIYFHLSVPGEFNLALRMRVPGSGESTIRATINQNQSKELTVEGGIDQIITVGHFNTTSVGYVKVDLQGVSRSGVFFAEVYELLVFGNSGSVYFVFDDFYFGRRGPSVHLRYDSTIDPETPFEYFYNEVVVPEDQDVIGAYYSAIAFSEGYFGIQVNGADERRILFSIWSAYPTDDPEEIPEEYRVILLKKGPDVVVQDFGDEGAGKQSFLRFNWSSNVSYKFLVYGVPIDDDNSLFTAWFQDPADSIWQLIASFQKPKRSTYIKSVYSFSENFIPEMGWIERKAFFANPWTLDSEGAWREVTSSTFTGDATSRKSRLDFACGVENGEFYLKNCGFLNNIVQTDQPLIREAGFRKPIVEIPELP